MRHPKSQKITIKDRLYGKFTIDSPVIIELLNSKPLQRLKGLNQYGIPDEFYHLKNYGSRYDHSIGVMLLLKKLGASEEEQIAGLTHDISHTAFSHVIDWVLGKGETEEYQDKQHESFLANSEVAQILKKYRIDPKQIANHKRFSLLEQEIPDLCADRIDYSIKEFPKKIANYCLDNMVIKTGEIVFRNQKSATLFARNFLKRQMIHWGGFEAGVRYELLAEALRNALKKNIIVFADFWEDDNFVSKKLKLTKNKEIQHILSILKNSSLKGFPKSKKVVYKKFRYVDPKFIKNGRLIRLTRVDGEFKKTLEKKRKINKKGLSVPQAN